MFGNIGKVSEDMNRLFFLHVLNKGKTDQGFSIHHFCVPNWVEIHIICIARDHRK